MRKLLAFGLALAVGLSGSLASAAKVINEGTITAKGNPSEALKVRTYADGTIQLMHELNGELTEVRGFSGLNQSQVLMLNSLANRRNLFRLLAPVPVAACASLLTGYAAVHLGVALHPNQGFGTLIIAMYLYAPVGLVTGAIAGYVAPLAAMSTRKKQRQAIRALAKVSTTVVGAQAVSPMPIPELIANLTALSQIASK